MITRFRGLRLSADKVKQLEEETLRSYFEEPSLFCAAKAQLDTLHHIMAAIAVVERQIRQDVKANPLHKHLQSVPGIGQVLATTILLETGVIERFASAGCYASYCRCVDSKRESNGKKKGENNRKNGNKYLAWAFMEAANFAIRYNERIGRYYQRKMSKTHRVVALKTVAHKLAKACFHIMKEGIEFDINKAFN